MSEILSKTSYDLPVAYTDGTTPYNGEHIARTHKDLRVQVPGALASIGYGVKSTADRSGLKITAGTGLHPVIAPGMAIVPSDTLVPAFIELVAAVTLDPLEANHTSDNPLYIYARQNSTSSPETGLARFTVGDSPDGEGLLLASITTSASAILTITDLRTFLGDEGQFRLRGTYASDTAYFAGGLTDVVSVAGALYYSLQNNNIGHTPASNPSWWAAFGSGSGLPSGGSEGQILAKNSGDDGDASWIDAPSGGSTGADGAPGSQWRTGGGVPSNSLGIDGDFYIDAIARNVYQRVSGVYVVKFSMIGAGYGGTSTSSVTVGTGSKTFATQTNLAYNVGSLVRATKTTDSSVFMQGLVTGYSGGNLTLNVTSTGGSETAASWALTLVGAEGAAGTDGNTILFGSGAPNDVNGQNGDVYIDTLNSAFYTKSAGSWGDGHSMVGPTGSVPDAAGNRLTQTSGTGQIVESAVTVESHSISYDTNDTTGSRGWRSRQFGDHNYGAHFEGHKARGSASSPTAPSSGDNIVVFDGYVWNGTAWVQSGAHYLQATESPTTGARGCQWRWTVIKNGTETEVTGLVLSQSQQLLLGGITSGDASAVLQIDDTARGLLIPRLTTSQRNAVSSPATGLLIFNTTSTEFEFWNGTTWTAIGNGSGGVFSSIASQSEAEAGTDNTKGMTPLRVAQAIAALGSSGGGSGGGGAWERIGTVTVGSGGASDATFSSIPDTYFALQIHGIARVDNGGSDTWVLSQFNSDTGGNYYWGRMLGTSLTGTSTYINLGEALPHSTDGSGSNTAMGIQLLLPGYANTSFHKPWFNQGGFSDLMIQRGRWASTSAISSIKLFPQSGSFAEGTEFVLYGLVREGGSSGNGINTVSSLPIPSSAIKGQLYYLPQSGSDDDKLYLGLQRTGGGYAFGLLTPSSFITGYKPTSGATINSGLSISLGLVLSLPFNEGSGTTINDKTSSPANGTLSSSGMWATDSGYDNILSFSGTHALIPYASKYNIETFTIAFAFKTAQSDSYGTIIQRSAGTKYNFAAFVGFPTIGKMEFGSYDGTHNPTADTTINVNNSTWHKCVITRTQGSALRLYIDGILRATGTDNTSAGSTLDTSDLNIGFEPGGGTKNYTGSFAYIHIWNRVLSGAPASIGNAATGEIASITTDEFAMYR